MLSPPSYSRVAQDEATSDSAPVDGSASQQHMMAVMQQQQQQQQQQEQHRSPSERLQDKIIAVLWVTLAVLVSRWTHFYQTVFGSSSSANDEWNESRVAQVHTLLLRLSCLGAMIVMAQLLYLMVYLPKVKGLDVNNNMMSFWNVYCPNVVPTMAVTGVLSYLLLLRAVWPIWGFVAPLIVGTQGMGVLFVWHLIPSFGLC